MSSTSDEELACTPENVKKEANSVISNLLPTISKPRYEKAYEEFIKWRSEKRVKSLSESVFLAYFNDLSKKLQPSSLWCIYSMLKATLSTNHNIDLKTYTKLIAFLKKNSAGYKSKKSRVFTAQDIETFLREAPDEMYLATKVALIFGITGACRTQELTNLKLEDVEMVNNVIVVKLTNTKTKIDRSFVVQDDFVEIIKKYHDLRPTHYESNRFFMGFRNGKYVNQAIGKNKLAAYPKQIAEYLKLPNAQLYTGHCFRRTSATLLADAGANLTTIKRLGGWKSGSVAEGYIEDSIQNKSKITGQIMENIQIKSKEPQPGCSKQPESNQNLNKEPPQIELSQTVQQLNIPGKPVTINLTNCSNFTLNFN